jgi:ribosome-interacting GTPase 1
MPANLSPEYKKADQAYRAARDDRERLDCLKEMLRTIPKHKGTENMQADIKSRIKELSDELTGPKKGAVRAGPVHTVRQEGAAQIALLGPPNAGKSSLHAKLTHSRAAVGPYPHTTHEPLPGMLPYEDVYFQLVDLPPVSADYFESWLANTLQRAAAVLLVVDLSDPACADDVAAILRHLDGKRITLTPHWPRSGMLERRAQGELEDDGALLDPFRLYLPTLLIANKADLGTSLDDVQVLKELTGVDFPALVTSAESGEGLDAIGRFLFAELEIVRIYTKTPGKPAEKDRPFTLRRGATVHDVARLVHKDLASGLKFARAWGTGVYDGQQVGPEHVVADRDVIELHMR